MVVPRVDGRSVCCAECSEVPVVVVGERGGLTGTPPCFTRSKICFFTSAEITFFFVLMVCAAYSRAQKLSKFRGTHHLPLAWI